MERKKIVFSLLFGILLVTIFSVMVCAAVTIVSPAASSIINGSPIVNVTIADEQSALGNNLVNVTVYAQSTLTANSSWESIATNNSLNISFVLGASTINRSIVTIDTTTLEDANNYILNVTVVNETSGTSIGTDTNTGITIDNYVPDTPSSLTPSDATTVTNNSFTFSATVNGSETTSCTLRFDGRNFGTSTYTMTHSGDTCTYSATSVPEESYRWYVRASDETNTTDSSVQTVTVDLPTSTAKIPALLQEPGVKSGGGATLVVSTLTQTVAGFPIWMIIIAVVIILYVVIKKR